MASLHFFSHFDTTETADIGEAAEGGQTASPSGALGAPHADPSPKGTNALRGASVPPASWETGGDGGCTARALAALGVFASAEDAAANLDAQIAPQHAKFVRERGECDEKDAGVRGEQWHDETIKNAVIAHGGWHMQRLCIEPTNPQKVDLKKEFNGGGAFLLLGVTNNQWYDGSKKKPMKYPDYSKNAPAHDPAAWMHSIAVKGNKVIDFELVEPVAKSLHLRMNNQPDPKKGYMRSIRKVYRLRKCIGGVGCKGKNGACVPAAEA